MTEVHFSDIWRVYSRFWWFSCIAIIFARMIVTWNLHTIPYLITTDARSPASQQHLQQKVGLRSGGAASTLTGYTASSTANSENLYPEETHTRWWELICHIPCDTFIVFFVFLQFFGTFSNIISRRVRELTFPFGFSESEFESNN